MATQVQPITDPAVLAASTKFKDLLEDVAGIAIERDDAIAALGMSIVAESNAFMAGLPGVAKSMIFSEIFARVEHARVGFYTITKGSTPETLVGPVSIKALEERDVIEYNTTDMLPDVHFAYITEVFKGNALTRNAVLQVLNERAFFNGGKVQPCPLHMCGSDSNEYPDSREDAAFYDRFLVRLQVDPITDFSKRMQMVKASLKRGRGFAKPNPMITLAELKTLMDARREVKITPEVEEAALQLVNTLNASDIKIGDRRFCDTFYLASANALLRGRETMTVDDLTVFMHTAWSNPDHKREVQQAVLRVISPETADVAKMYDEVVDAFQAFLEKKREADEAKDRVKAMAANTEFGDAAEAHLDEIDKRIKVMRADQRDVVTAVEMRAKVEAMIQDAQNLALRRRTTTQVDDVAA